MAFQDSIDNPPVKRYRTKLTTLLDSLPGEEADALDAMLASERYTHTYVSRAIRSEQASHPDIDPNLFIVSDKTVARWREDVARVEFEDGAELVDGL